ncbi:conjugal transfer protein TraG N-terminal domain-containing protein [uncultured Lamprocystis sp.]|jgi:conjugal transfer mating pair stabilization protein TraG|uniref:conjugal transfer protein TraG N-terminal domain-containing protein n=1 Tax=uncultured Lamprocystis sp. TaxID=543132 RepID=UPI0026008604|nr:conjugal transfer protein TraG N-terminal domain-containing protein [uncultured Lamprocystis sp.]
MWEIVSIGDAAYLTAVLNAVAMLSGSGDMRTLAGIGFLVGLLLILFQGIIQARPPQLQHLLVAWVIYLGMFGPTVRLSVEDVYSGAVRVVDNVPLGPAAIGSAMSQIGFGVARLFEQAFSTPAMTEYGFAAPLHILQGVRKTTLSMTALGAANAPTAGADMAKTFVNYLSECTLYGYNNGTRSADDILRNPNWADALGSSLVVPTTQLWIGGNPVTKECPEAWGDLSAYLMTQYEPALRRSVAATLGIRNPDEVPGAVNAALDAIAGGGVGAQNYMVMATAAAFLPYAEAKNKRDLLQYQDAVAIEQAAQQRNTQWASEERLFARIVRPMMTFFEAFLFAVSPLMVFAVGLGPVGIRMVGKYLLFGLWIQLWQPILAIINLYLLMAIRFKLDALQDAGLGNTPLPSIYAIWKLDFLISDYLGVGGMLAASTPAISLMLIYGSAVTATHLAGRLQGGDLINEKIASPDVVNPAAALTVGPIHDHGPIRGTAAPGAESVTWTANVGQDVQRDLRSSQQAMERSSQGFASALSSAASLTASRSGESFEGHASTWMKDGAKSATDQVVWQTAEGLTQQYRESGLSTNQLAAILSGGLGGAANFRGSSQERQEAARADISSKLQSQYQVQTNLADEMATDIARKVTSSEGLETRIAEALKVDSSSGNRNVFSAGLRGEESSNLTKSADDILSSSRSLDHAESQAERFGTLGSYNGVPTGAALVRPENQAQIERLEQQIARYNLDGDVQYETHRLLAGGVTADPEQARAMAGMGLLLGHADGERVRSMTAGERASAKEAGMEILSGLFNFRTPDRIAPDRNADLSGTVPGFGATRSQVDAVGLRDARPDAQGLPEQVAAHARGVQDTWSPTAPDRFAQGAGRDVSTFRSDRQHAMHLEQQATLGAIIEQRALLPRTAAQIGHNEVGGVFARLAESGAVTRAGAEGVAGQVTAGAKAFAQSLMDGKGLGASLQAGREAAGDEQGWTAAREALIDARMRQISSYGLTPAQAQLYRQATESVFSFAPTAAQQTARQAVIDESGPRTGAHLAELIERSAGSKDDSDLRLIGAYNRTTVEEKKSHEQGLSKRGGVEQPLVAPAHLSGHFREVERKYDLPSGLLTAIAYVESTFNLGAVSPAGAQGMFQIMPKTAAALGVANPFDPVEAAEGAAMHLARDYRTFGNWEHAVMAYNAGPQRIQNYLAGIGRPLKQETLDYLPKVEAALRRVNAST